MQAYIYDKRSQTWERIQDLPKSHMTQLCGVVSEAGIPKYVLLSQGMYYDLESGTWTTDEGEREIHTTNPEQRPLLIFFSQSIKTQMSMGACWDGGILTSALQYPLATPSWT